MNNASALRAGIEYLKASEIEPGIYAYHLAAHKLRAVSGWLTIAEADLRRFGYSFDGNPISTPQAYRAMLDASAQMPSWWSPKQRYAFCHGRIENGALVQNRRDIASTWRFSDQSSAENLVRLTADVRTGFEVPA